MFFQHFLELLLTHSKSEHGVNFYAEKLCITPQYLSLILKELTGKSASKWIDEALLMEAKVLLKTPNSTIQQVADMLNIFRISLLLVNSLRNIWEYRQWSTGSLDLPFSES